MICEGVVSEDGIARCRRRPSYLYAILTVRRRLVLVVVPFS